MNKSRELLIGIFGVAGAIILLLVAFEIHHTDTKPMADSGTSGVITPAQPTPATSDVPGTSNQVVNSPADQTNATPTEISPQKKQDLCISALSVGSSTYQTSHSIATQELAVADRIAKDASYSSAAVNQYNIAVDNYNAAEKQAYDTFSSILSSDGCPAIPIVPNYINHLPITP